MTQITIDDTIHSIAAAYPEIIDLLADFGFTQIRQPMMIQTVGRYMTLRKGCEMRGFDIELLIHYLRDHGIPVEEIK